jgi:hypothetical protein
MSPEGRLNKDFSLVDQHCRREDAMENRILPLGQERANDSQINDTETRKNIVEEIIEEENQTCIERSQDEYLNKSQTNAEKNRRESEEVTENVIGKNRVIIEEEKQICVEETENIKIENKMDKDNNQIAEIFVNIEQVFSPQTNRNLNTVKSVPSGKVDEQGKALVTRSLTQNPILLQTITDVM